MRRTSIVIDDELLASAQQALSTTGLKETVDAAFRAVVRADRRDRLAERIATGRGVDRSPTLLDESRPTR